MMDNALTFLSCAGFIPWLLAALGGLLLGWLLFRGKKVQGDLTVEGEGRLRAEADELRAKLRTVEAQAATKDTEVSNLKGKLAAAAAGAGAAAVAAKAVAPAAAKDDEETYALEWRNRYLAARVKYLEGRLSEDDKPAPKAKAKAKAKKAPATKKAPAKRKTAVKKKTVAKAAAAPKARKKPGPKPGSKRGALNKDGTPRKKPGPKGTKKPAMTEKEAQFEKYYTNVKKYHGPAKRPVVQKVVNYLGVALNNRDTSLVACSDPKERERIIKGYAAKKLGLNEADATKLVEKVCVEMKSNRQKSRVTFYYLMAKHTKQLGLFGG